MKKRRGRVDLEQMLSAVDEREIIATLSSQWESHQSHEVSTARVIAIKTLCSEKSRSMISKLRTRLCITVGPVTRHFLIIIIRLCCSIFVVKQ